MGCESTCEVAQVRVESARFFAHHAAASGGSPSDLEHKRYCNWSRTSLRPKLTPP